jgi:hypothetical protein
MEKTMSETGTLEDRALDDAELDAVAGGVVVEKIGPDDCNDRYSDRRFCSARRRVSRRLNPPE